MNKHLNNWVGLQDLFTRIRDTLGQQCIRLKCLYNFLNYLFDICARNRRRLNTINRLSVVTDFQRVLFDKQFVLYSNLFRYNCLSNSTCCFFGVQWFNTSIQWQSYKYPNFDEILWRDCSLRFRSLLDKIRVREEFNFHVKKGSLET